MKIITCPLSLLTTHPLYYQWCDSSIEASNLPWITKPSKTKGQLWLVRATNLKTWITWEHVPWKRICISSILTVKFFCLFNYSNTEKIEDIYILITSLLCKGARQQQLRQWAQWSPQLQHQCSSSKRCRKKCMGWQGSPGPFPLWKSQRGRIKRKGTRIWACRSLLLLTYGKEKSCGFFLLLLSLKKKVFPVYYLLRYVIFKCIQLRWKIQVVLLHNSLNGG